MERGTMCNCCKKNEAVGVVLHIPLCLTCMLDALHYTEMVISAVKIAQKDAETIKNLF